MTIIFLLTYKCHYDNNDAVKFRFQKSNKPTGRKENHVEICQTSTKGTTDPEGARLLTYSSTCLR